MARIFLCAPTLADYILTSKWDPAMPEAFIVTPERLSRLRTNLALSEREASQSTANAKRTTHDSSTAPLEEATI